MELLRLARLRLRARGRLEVQGRPRVGPGVRIAVARGARVVLEDGARLGEGCRIEARACTIRIGRGAVIGERAVIVALAGVDVGAGCMVGDWALVTDGEPTYADPERPIRLQPVRSAPVALGEGARIGLHAAVLAGATVAEGAAIAPYAVVTAARAGDRAAAPGPGASRPS